MCLAMVNSPILTHFAFLFQKKKTVMLSYGNIKRHNIQVFKLVLEITQVVLSKALFKW